jgi:hypothetical protein
MLPLDSYESYPSKVASKVYTEISSGALQTYTTDPEN